MTLTSSHPHRQEGLLTPSRMLFLTLCATLLPAELFTAAAAGLYLLYVFWSGKEANARAFSTYLPFLVMAGYGLLLSGDNLSYGVGKDAWYALKLCLCLGLGCLIGFSERDSMTALRTLVLFSTLTALAVVFLWAILGITPMAPGQTEGGGFRLPLVSVAAIPILLERLRHEKSGRFLVPAAQLGVLLLAILLSDSRVTILAAGATVVAWAGSLANTRNAIIGVIIVCAVGVGIWYLLPEYTGGPLTVAVKLRRSLDEVLLTDGFDPTEMVLNWRGFEAYNAQLMFDHASLGRKLFGHGLGATVDLGNAIDIGGDEPIRFLPILHNGFYNILIKYGVLGVAIYLFAVMRLMRMGLSTAGRGLIEDRLLRGLVVVILLSTAVITGLYNKSVLHGVALLAGWLIGLLSHYRSTAGAQSDSPVPSGQLLPIR